MNNAYIFDILSAVTALAAAFYWFLTSRIQTPDSFVVHVVAPRLKPLLLDGTYVGQAQSEDFDVLSLALRSQSRLNSLGAFWAAISAGGQGIKLLLVYLGVISP